MTLTCPRIRYNIYPTSHLPPLTHLDNFTAAHFPQNSAYQGVEQWSFGHACRRGIHRARVGRWFAGYGRYLPLFFHVTPLHFLSFVNPLLWITFHPLSHFYLYSYAYLQWWNISVLSVWHVDSKENSDQESMTWAVDPWYCQTVPSSPLLWCFCFVGVGVGVRVGVIYMMIGK